MFPTSKVIDFSFFLLLFILFEPYFSSEMFQSIPLDTIQTHTLFSQDPLSFQIINYSQLQFETGIFNVSVTLIDPQTTFDLVLSRKACNTVGTDEFYSKKTLSFENKASISFKASSSNYTCFEVQAFTGTQPFSVNLEILVKFHKINDIIQVNTLSSVELPDISDKLLSYRFRDYRIQIIQLTVKSTHLSPSTQESMPLELFQNEGMCIQSDMQGSIFKSWLCYFVQPKKNFVFSLNNYGDLQSCQIIINEIRPQEIDTDIITKLSFSIPNFGSLFIVNLSLPGVLQIKADSDDGKNLPIIASDSLYRLFISLGPESRKASIYERNALIKSKDVNTRWYYFIPATFSDNFLLQSNFMKQITLAVGTEEVFYINPEIYEYQHFKAQLTNTEFVQRYEVFLHSEHPDSLINIYYSQDINKVLNAPFPDKKSFSKKVSSTNAKSSTVSLSFIAESYDSTAYLTVSASQKGFYRLKIINNPLLSSLEIVTISCLVFLIVVYLISCAKKLYRLTQSNDEVLEIYAWTINQANRSPENNSHIQLSAQDVVPFNANTNFISTDTDKHIIKVLEKLKIQQKFEKSKEFADMMSQNNIPENDELHEHNLKIIHEDEICNICYEARKTIIFEPCNHMCSCSLCALALIQISPKCPLCRSCIKEVQIAQDMD